ncbi:hypothetical protein Tco_0266102 [Tanacetum coccineum]
MLNRHKNWLVHKQTAYGKDFSNPFMVDNLPKIVGFSTHLASLVKSWLVQDQTVLALASPKANELTIPEQTATGKGTSNPFMAGSLPKTTKPTYYKDGKEHLKMEMEIPCSNKIKFITACSFSNDSFEDIMKAQVSVIKASATLNIQAFKIKKSVSISFRMTQVHKMAKDHMMMIKDYDWMMISKKLKDHIQVKLKPKSLKFTASDSQDTDQ